MIRLRDEATGAEAEWDDGAWSGDEAFVRRLRTLAKLEHAEQGPGSPPSVVQARMAERFPAAGGIVVVDQTKPKEWPRFDKDGLEIVY